MMLLLLLIITVIVLVHAFHFVKNREMYKLNLPGPFAWPFIGNASQFLGSSNEAILNTVTYLTTNWPTPLRFWLGPKYCILVAKPEDIQVVLNSPHTLTRSELYQFLRTIFGDGLVTLNGK